MVKIDPIQLYGAWDIGYALDVHMKTSILIGEDPYGNTQFDSTRSEIGELIYGFKYRQKIENLEIITDTIINFLDQHPEMRDFESIIPVPPTPDNHRPYQPTFEISKAVAAKLNVFCNENVLEKQSGIQLKGITAEEKKKLGNFIVKTKQAKRKHNVLILDDVFKTGITLNNCAKRMREDPNIEKIYVLVITKTKNQ